MSSRVYPLYTCQNNEEKINTPIITADLVIDINNCYSNNDTFNLFNYNKKNDNKNNNNKLYSIV